MVLCPDYHVDKVKPSVVGSTYITGWERTGQMLCIVDTSLSVLRILRMCIRELWCLFTNWI